jgi:hypothetical protein
MNSLRSLEKKYLDSQKMTVMKHSLFLLLALLLPAATSFAQNVMISDQYNPSEPSIMMDPSDPARMLAGTVLNNYYVSADTGKTWTTSKLTSPYGVWGDPVLIVDTAGAFYYFHLSNPPGGNWIDRIVCQKSTDGGLTWSDGTYMGLNGAKAQDKHWAVVDRTNNNIYVTWTQFDKYGSTNPADSSLILFSKSTDGGETWSPALRINEVAGDCIDDDNTVEGAVPAVGPNGEIYVAWAGPAGIVFDRSLDQGETWLENDIFIDPMPTGWAYEIPGIYRANGLPVTVCDLSGGPHHGTIYVNWTDQRNGEDDTDVWLSKSTDGGDTWSPAVRINDDGPGKQQFFTWMTVDQVTGNLWFVFYDRRNHDNNATDVYLAWSTDGGETFVNQKISESPFVPNPGVFFGDYTNIVAHDGIIRPIWTRLHNGQLSIWTHLMHQSDVISGVGSRQPDQYELQEYPNPASDIVYFSFKLRKAAAIDLILYDTTGRVVTTIASQAPYDYGRHIIPVDLKALNLAPGTYFGKLLVNGEETVRKVVVVE